METVLERFKPMVLSSATVFEAGVGYRRSQVGRGSIYACLLLVSSQVNLAWIGRSATASTRTGQQMVVHTTLCHGPRCISSKSISSIAYACPKAVLGHLRSGSADSVLSLEILP